MQTIKVNEWQEMALKKDVELIAKKIDRGSPVFWSLCWDAAIAFSAILLDHLFAPEKLPNWVWIVVAIAAIVPLAVILVYRLILFIRAVISTQLGHLDNKKHIDTFDNQICYWIMIANSYIQMMKEIPDDDKINKVFVYEEACYYNNKCEQALYSMKSVLGSVFSNDGELVRSGQRVAVHRLKGIVQMLSQQNIQLDDLVSAIESDEEIIMQKAINEEYNNYYADVLKDITELFDIPMP